MEILSPPRCQGISYHQTLSFSEIDKSLSFCTRRRKRIVVEVVQCFRIGCSLGHQGLKPRPLPLPPLPRSSTIDIDEQVNKSESVPNETQSWKSGPAVCAQIEKSVLHKRYLEALELFELLECDDYYDVESSTYDAMVSACIETRSIRGVKRVYNHMNVCGYDPDQYMSNRVLLMHVKCGMMIDARKLFDEMPVRNLVSWNTIIGGLVDSGNYMEAFHLFLTMWNDFSEAGARTFATMIKASAGIGIIFVGKQFHACSLKSGFGNDIFISCSLIDMYGKTGSIEDARCVFNEMQEKTTVSWNSIIAGYALHGYSEEALEMYYEMKDSGAKMDHFTFSIIIRVCTRLASLEHARQAHAGLVRHGFSLDTVASTTLVDFYSKWGRIEDARNVFEKMPRKNVISWNALIAGYGNHGRGIEAVDLFRRMVREGNQPNHVTFLAVLSACSYSGLSKLGWEIFESMSETHRVKPRPMHYACMIELLGREGFLEEAFDFISEAPFNPTVNMWAALLTACRVKKDLVLGKIAAERIYGMEPEKLGNYVVLLNIYNSLGLLREAADVVKTLKRKGIEMHRASTWIEVKKEQHVFHSGDKSHYQTKEIYKKVEELVSMITRKHGYVAENTFLLPDVDEKEEKMVFYHSEKLAIGFGLINTGKTTALQLVQSHRICVDCHSAVKLISDVVEREIVVRDASRFHRFKNGFCSCGDYW
ncbi:pentatricopeptide repeat-containing protein At5g50390, chloroplastic [Impatiens glandulifera]|uniref:pentatricopeptide repeat-containing protein At5g50390, chloroplastic n=1 Tax=Impatiens glandulifera TaxID=253017 RepID=UPI001FB0D032|nr:pentatricopeptide repeat-containing protein At5g50390, chloroplastic [Impatiens glandulifera]